MHIMLCTLTLRLHDIHSLKDKRSIVKGLIYSAQHQLHISVAEVAEQDTLNLAIIAAVAVGGAKAPLRELAQSMERMALQSGADLVDCVVEWL